MHNLFSRFKNEEGVTAIEYGLIAMLVFFVAVGSIINTGNSVSAFWTAIKNAF